MGLETARLLAREGYLVFAGIRNPRKITPFRVATRGLSVRPILLDVDRTGSIRSAARLLSRRAGRLDILIHNAGWGAFGAVSEFTDREMTAQFRTNVVGPVLLTRECLPLLRTCGGRVILVGSLAGRMPFAGIGLYCASKFALGSMAESLRLELRPSGVDVTLLEPGHFKTAFKDNRRRAEAYERGRSSHQEVLSRVLAFGNRPKGPGPEVAARRIAGLLRRRRWGVRYPVGLDARWVPFASWFLPPSLEDFLMRRVYGRFQPPIPPPVHPRSGHPVVLVTGATSGIGLAVVRRLAAGGGRVWATYRDRGKMARARRSLGALPVRWIGMEVDRTPSVRRAIRLLLREEGRLDVVVNNAGFVCGGFWEDFSRADLEAQFRTNVFGPMRVCRETLPALRSSGGRVINLGSMSGFKSIPLMGPYAASKAAVRALTGALRMEEGPWGVQVSEIDPGEIRTGIESSARLAERRRLGTTRHGSIYDAFEGEVRSVMEQAPPPEAVAEVAWKALRDRRMRRYYLVNRSSRISRLIQWVLPDAAWEYLLARHFTWCRWPRKGDGGADR